MTNPADYGSNPFTPNFSRPPPHLAGRGKETARWAGLLARLKKADPSAGVGDILLMYGPRGTGKTALLDRFAAMADSEGVDVVRLQSSAFKSGAQELGDKLLLDVQRPGYRRESRESHGAFRLRGLFGMGRRYMAKYRDPAEHGFLKSRLEAQCRKKPVGDFGG